MGDKNSNNQGNTIPLTRIREGPLIGIRHVQTLLMFLLLSIGYSMRVNLSVGIVAMTRAGTSPNPDVPTYAWKNTGLALSSFFMGYITLQVLAGELGKRYGVKWFLVAAMALNSVGCILTPAMAAWFGLYGVMAIRIVQGISQGFFFPSVHNILGKWAPKEERSTLGNIIFTGVAFGTIIAMPITGIISASWAGWPAAFYCFGSAGLVWCLIWIIFGSNNPQESKYISVIERQFIQTSIGHGEETAVPPTPWKAIFTSLPVWAIVVANSGQNWGYITLLTEIPNYLSNVAHQDISKNSVMSAAPYLALFILGLMFGPIADLLIAKKIMTTGNTRKLMNTIGSVCPAVILTMLGFVPAENVNLIVTFLIITVGINAAIWCGFQVNPVDLSPRYSGILMGISNGSSNIFSIISPLMVDLLVSDLSDPKQWRTVFIIAGAVYVASDIFYILFAQGERQWWDGQDDHHVEEGQKFNTSTTLSTENDAKNEETRLR